MSHAYDCDLHYPGAKVAGYLGVRGLCNTVVNETVLSLMIGYWKMLSLDLEPDLSAVRKPNFLEIVSLPYNRILSEAQILLVL